MAYDIIQKFISKNRSGKILNPVGTVVHETATPNASDEAEFRYFDGGAGGRSVSVHAFVDYDSITQTMPWNEQAWHAGGTANRTRIGIELCHYDDKSKFDEVYKRAVWMFAYVHVNILNLTTVTKDNLMSHAEVSQKWKETNHTDPIAYFAKFGKTVDGFRNDVQQEINSMLNIKEVERKVDNMSIKDVQKLCNKLEVTDYEGKALVEDGINGKRTESARVKLKELLTMVLK